MSKELRRHVPGMQVIDRWFRVPHDHAHPGSGELEVFAREVVQAGREKDDLPYLVFLQGGPGFGSPRPLGLTGWLEVACAEYRVLLLDQRGTGSSAPISSQTLAGMTPAEQAAELALYRADSIVKDAEIIRRELLGPDGRWTLLGQSFGGFCSVHYLSAAPEGLAGVLITGGLPPLDAHCDEVYRRTYVLTAERNRRYYERYPEDVERARAIVARLSEHKTRLPASGFLTPRRFQQLGQRFGMSDGFEMVHYLIEQAFVPGNEGPEPNHNFLREYENALGFDCCPIYAILHEPCYAQGFATRWSAERVLADFPEFALDGDGPVFFTGETVHPFLFETVDMLRPLGKAADLLAEKADWPRLYDPDILAKNEVPCVAALYADDMYVARDLSEETARTIRGCRVWITNEFDHDGLRTQGAKLLPRLLDMLHGRA